MAARKSSVKSRTFPWFWALQRGTRAMGRPPTERRPIREYGRKPNILLRPGWDNMSSSSSLSRNVTKIQYRAILVPVIRLFGVDPGPVVNIKWDAWTLVFLYKFHKNFELAFKEICHRLLKRAEALSWRNTSNYSVLIPLKLEY